MKTVVVSTHKRRVPGRGGGSVPGQEDGPLCCRMPPSFQALLSASRLVHIDIAYGEGVVVGTSGEGRVIDVCLHPTVLSRLWVHGPKTITRCHGSSIPLFTVHWSGAHDEALPKSAQVRDVLAQAWDGGWRGPSIRWALRPAWRGGRAAMGDFKMDLYQAYATQHGYNEG